MAEEEALNGAKSQDDADLPSFEIWLAEGVESGANFHSVNDLRNPWQRTTVVERGGLVSTSCKFKDIVHGTYSPQDPDPATLVVLQFRFDPEDLKRRIKRVQITVTFAAMDPEDPDPEVVKAYPEGHFAVHPTTQHESVKWTAGGKAGGGAYGAEVAGKLKREKEVEKDATYAATVSGAIRTLGRNSGEPNSVVWTLMENTADHTGVPVSLRGAILVKRADVAKFQACFTIKVTPDRATQLQSLFKSDPKDEPVWFDPGKKPTNKLRVYDAGMLENLDGLDLESQEFSDITFRTIWQQDTKLK